MAYEAMARIKQLTIQNKMFMKKMKYFTQYVDFSGYEESSLSPRIGCTFVERRILFVLKEVWRKLF
ncbi:hypothetical protein P5673_009944 [Acropora cervicornis]|uniref:Uncharacterized protein n=1 Tax=Acropora cervicornis TaxID=6130 RepID=A0AAD9QS82_ACRCE|nr:hypothetical protein P5673_009944 [Acropora cervicornis]